MSPLPASEPARRELRGSYATLEPLDPDRHGEDLVRAGAAAPEASWEFLPYGPWRSPDEHLAWLRERAAAADPIFWAAVVEGHAQGLLSLTAIVPEHGRAEIAHVWLGAELRQTRAATEAFALLMAHAFQSGNRRLEWKTDARNLASRAAAERLGFSFEGIFRQHMWIKDSNRDTAWFALLDGDWPEVRVALREWLAPENFDSAGAQRTPLARSG